MKKWLVFLCIFFLILSFVIYIYDVRSETDLEGTSSPENIYSINVSNNNEELIYDELKSGKIIKLKIVETGEIIDIDLYDYLRGVVASEMPANYSIEALKAQAIVARTYMYKKMRNNTEIDADVCNSSSHCQVYQDKEEIFRLWKLLKGWSDEEIEINWKKINTAVISTDDIVITYNSDLIEAFFHASSPIRTENSDQIWGKIYYPYLISVENIEDENYSNRESEVEIDFGYFEDKIRANLNPNFILTNNDIKINSYTTSGRVKDVLVDDMCISAEKLRTLFGIKSTLFTIEKKDTSFIFKVIGYGHGVGMSQVGADYLAKKGMNCEQIIKYYYTGVNLEKIH